MTLFNLLPTEFKERMEPLIAHVRSTQTYNMPGRAVLAGGTLDTLLQVYNGVRTVTLAALGKYHGQLGATAVDGLIQWWHALLCGWGIDDPSSHPDAFPSKTPGATLTIVELMVSNNRAYVEEGGRLLPVLRAAGTTTCLRTDVQHGYDHVFWATSWPLGAQDDSSSQEGCFYIRAVTRYIAFLQGYRIQQAVLLGKHPQLKLYLRGNTDSSRKPNINYAPLLLNIDAGYPLPASAFTGPPASVFGSSNFANQKCAGLRALARAFGHFKESPHQIERFYRAVQSSSLDSLSYILSWEHVIHQDY